MHTDAQDRPNPLYSDTNELIVFVDKTGRPTGELGPKIETHNHATKLHLAFSCYLFDNTGKLLITQRAQSKKVWPGIWTNSFCGHPGPRESPEDAVIRRAKFELGAAITNIKCVVQNYTYSTPPYHGIIEHEFCPIFTATLDSSLQPNPNEVEDCKWMDVREYIKHLQSSPDDYSYWCKDQLPYLMKSNCIEFNRHD